MGKGRTDLVEIMGRAASAYDRMRPRLFTEIARRLVERAQVPAGARVLDLAMGPGTALAWVPDASLAVGVDLARPMVWEARRRLLELGRHVSGLCVMDAEVLGFRSGAFTHVLCSSALYQFEAAWRAEAEIHRVLCAGGTLALSAFGRADRRWEGVDELFARLAPLQRHAGFRRYQPGHLCEELLRRGFGEVRAEAERLELHFTDVDSWLATAWSHSRRRSLEGMAASGTLSRFRAELPRVLEGARQPDGRLAWCPEIVYAVARKA